MFKNAKEFIALVASSNYMEAYDWIKKNPSHISSLFKDISQLIQLVNTGDGIGGEVAYQLIAAQSDVLVKLLKKDTDLIQLAKVNRSPAIALCNLQSQTVAILFYDVDSFIRLATQVNLNLACSLIQSQPYLIYSLFRNKADIQKLADANSQVASVLKAAIQTSADVPNGLLKDLFPPLTIKNSIDTPIENQTNNFN